MICTRISDVKFKNSTSKL